MNINPGGCTKKCSFTFSRCVIHNSAASINFALLSLCISLSDWAKYRRTKGAIKLHLLLDHAGYLPQFVNITPNKTHEVQILKKLALDPGSIIVFDRGLIDFATWTKWISQGVFFVTRMKSNAVFRVIKRNSILKNGPVLKARN